MLSCFARTILQRKVLQSSVSMSTLALSSVVEELNRLAPLFLAESWDNVGLLVEPSQPKSVGKILLTNDLTEPVMKEAISSSVDLIYSYHPPIFAPLKRLTSSSWKERLVTMCLENRIAVYSPHTCLDALKGGVNDWLALAFGSNVATCEPLSISFARTPLRNCTHMIEIPLPFNNDGKKVVREVIRQVASIPDARLEEHISTADGYEQMTVMCPEKFVPSIVKLVNESVFAEASRSIRIIRVEKPPLPGYGTGRLVRLTNPLPLTAVVDLVKCHLKLDHVRLATSTSSPDATISSIAICAGSGGSVLKNVAADVYLTGEMSHHEVLDAVHRGVNVILCEHSNTERGFLGHWKNVMKDAMNQVEIVVSASDHDPLEIV